MVRSASVSKLCAGVFAVAVLCAGAASAAEVSLELGVPVGFGSNTIFGDQGSGFGAYGGFGSDLGIRLHFSKLFALQPSLSIFAMDGATNIGLNLDALFYLFESNGVRQYLGANLGVNITKGDSDFRLGGIYGLQHEITKAVDVFAQTGFGARFEPGRFYTVNTQAGLIFYILK